MDPSKPQISKYLSPLSIADFYMDFANDEFEFPEKSTIAVRILEIQDLYREKVEGSLFLSYIF